MPALVEKTAWPAEGIKHGSLPDDYTWGYLYLYSDGRANFIETDQPGPAEIESRWGHYFREED